MFKFYDKYGKELRCVGRFKESTVTKVLHVFGVECKPVKIQKGYL